jgi:hypothetical protein
LHMTAAGHQVVAGRLLPALEGLLQPEQHHATADAIAAIARA